MEIENGKLFFENKHALRFLSLEWLMMLPYLALTQERRGVFNSMMAV